MAKQLTKTFFFLYLLSISFRTYADPTFWSLINNVNLIFHEAGHIFFIFFGDFLHTAGGTLFEFGIPLFLAFYFLIRKDLFATAFCFWWLSTAFYSISTYAGDARLQKLPLLGGDKVGHDWFNMLSSLRILQQTEEVASLFFTLSVVSLSTATYFFYLNIKPSIIRKIKMS